MSFSKLRIWIELFVQFRTIFEIQYNLLNSVIHHCKNYKLFVNLTPFFSFHICKKIEKSDNYEDMQMREFFRWIAEASCAKEKKDNCSKWRLSVANCLIHFSSLPIPFFECNVLFFTPYLINIKTICLKFLAKLILLPSSIIVVIFSFIIIIIVCYY